MANDRHLWPVLSEATLEELVPIAELLHQKDIEWIWDQQVPLTTLRQQLHDNVLLNGGNSFANLFRGKGVDWAEIVRDVAGKLSVKTKASDATVDIERIVALNVLERAIDEMTPEQKEELRDNLQRAGLPRDIPLGQGTLVAGLIAGRLAGFAAYKVLVIVANAVAKVLVGRGLTFAANATITRLLGVALGPIGWAMTAVWTAIDIAGPAYRITIPVVVMVGVLRASKTCPPVETTVASVPQ